MSVLEEVCDDKMYLESLVAAKTSLLSDHGHRALAKLGGRGRILLSRYFIPSVLDNSKGREATSNQQYQLPSRVATSHKL